MPWHEIIFFTMHFLPQATSIWVSAWQKKLPCARQVEHCPFFESTEQLCWCYSPFQRVWPLLILMSVWGKRGRQRRSRNIPINRETVPIWNPKVDKYSKVSVFHFKTLPSLSQVLLKMWRKEAVQSTRYNKWGAINWGAWQILVKCWATFS